MSANVTIREKTFGDEASAANLIYEAFAQIYDAVSNGNETAAKAFLAEELKWRGKNRNMFIARRDGRDVGIIEAHTQDTGSVPDHIYVELPMKHFGIANGLRAFYILSLMGRPIEHYECVIAHLGVTASERRTGIARRLIERVSMFAREREAEILSLWVGASNESAIRLYESEGFEIRASKKSSASARFLNEETWHKMSRPAR